MNKKIMLFLILALVLLAGCSKKQKGNVNMEQVRTGTQGIIVNFMPNNPPDEIYITQSDAQFATTLEIRNLGAYPQPDDTYSGMGPKGKVYLSGYDPNIITFQVKEQNSEFADLNKLALEGKSGITPNGGMDIVTFVIQKPLRH